MQEAIKRRRGRPPKNPTPDGAAKPDDAAAAPAPAGPPEGEAPKRHYKRRRGELRVKLPPLPEEVLGVVALGPLFVVGSGVRAATKVRDPKTRAVLYDGVRLEPNPAVIAAVGPAFNTWLESIDFSLTPGWGLLACYALALGTAVPNAMAQFGDRAAVKEALAKGLPIPQPAAKPAAKSEAKPEAKEGADAGPTPDGGSAAKGAPPS